MDAPRILTFGCRLNSFESEVMREQAAAAGLSNAIIVNGCAVTAEAERQVRQAIRRARRRHPEARIVVTGCGAQIAPEEYAAMEEVDWVAGNAEKVDADFWAGLAEAPRVSVGDVMAARETASHMVAGFEGRTRAFVEIQQGCDHRCTFCVIPFGRGASRSSAPGAIVEQARRLVAGGCREIVLTGVDITDYGKDLPGAPTLGGLVRRLLKLVPGLPRLRLSSIDPAEADEDLYDAIASEPRLMPHLHLSAQSGDDTILKRMKRRHVRADIENFVARVRGLRPDSAFGADLIAGFPTETEEAFRNTLSLVEECELTWLHVFPYSERPGTPAARMPQVPGEARKARAASLREAGTLRARRFLDARVGGTADVLVEREGKGRSPQFAAVRIEDGAPAGAIVSARMLRRDGETLLARKAA